MMPVGAVSQADCSMLELWRQWRHGHWLWSVACTVQPVEKWITITAFASTPGRRLAAVIWSDTVVLSCWDRVQSLYVIHSGIHSQCRSFSSGVTWSYFCAFAVRHAAALTTICSRWSLHWGIRYSSQPLSEWVTWWELTELILAETVLCLGIKLHSAFVSASSKPVQFCWNCTWHPVVIPDMAWWQYATFLIFCYYVLAVPLV